MAKADVELLEPVRSDDVQCWFADLIAKINQYVGVEGNEEMAMIAKTDVEEWFETNVRKLNLSDKMLIELQHRDFLDNFLCREAPSYLRWGENERRNFMAICRKILDERRMNRISPDAKMPSAPRYATREEIAKYIGYIPEEETPEKVDVVEGNARMTKKEAPMIAVSCECGKAWHHPCGTLDPLEGRCSHSFRYDPTIGTQGVISCINCTLKIYMVQLMDQCHELKALYEPERNTLADTMTALKDENREVLAENAKLRRRIEMLERKGKK